jgi:hypothetical protein
VGGHAKLDAPTFVRLISGAFPETASQPDHNNVVNDLFLSHHKYAGANRWHLSISQSELVRLERLYGERSFADDYRVDAVVTFARGRFAQLEPDPARFVSVFETRRSSSTCPARATGSRATSDRFPDEVPRRTRIVAPRMTGSRWRFAC